MNIYKISNVLIPNNRYRREEYKIVLEELIKIIREDEKDKVIIFNGNFHNRMCYVETRNVVMEIKKEFYDLGFPVIITDGKYDYDYNCSAYISKEKDLSSNIKCLNSPKMIYLEDNEQYEYKGLIFYKGDIEKEEDKKYYEIKEDNLNLIYQGYEDKINGYKIINYDGINLSEEKTIELYNKILDPMSLEEKYEYIKNDRLDILREILINKNIGEFVSEQLGVNHPLYYKLNEKEVIKMWKLHIDERIKKASIIYKEKSLLEWDEYKELITVLIE
jgi:hypothetical protein